MKQLIFVIFCAFALAASAQSSFPPKSFPSSIKVMTDAGVAQYWDVKRMMCLGKSGNGYKFRIYGQGEATMGSRTIDVFYILPGNKLQPAGSYAFPAITAGEPFNFEIVSAYAGYAPKTFLGFMIMDENLKIPEMPTADDLPQEIQSMVKATEITIVKDEEEEVIRPAADEDAVYSVTEVPPAFPGGTAAIFTHIAKTMRYPMMAQENGVQGRVIVGFVVEKDGTLGDVKVVKGVDSDLDKEALRVINTLPKFTPGKINGRPVRTSMSLPVTFRLQ